MFNFVSGMCDLIIAAAAAFHLYWGLGGKLGLRVSLPQREDGQFIITQRRFDSFAFGCVLMCFLLLIIALQGIVSLPLPFYVLRVSVGIISLVALARALSWNRYFGLFKKLRTTEFAKFDTWLYSPLCLMLGLGLLYLILVKKS